MKLLLKSLFLVLVFQGCSDPVDCDGLLAQANNTKNEKEALCTQATKTGERAAELASGAKSPADYQATVEPALTLARAEENACKNLEQKLQTDTEAYRKKCLSKNAQNQALPSGPKAEEVEGEKGFRPKRFDTNNKAK